MSGRYAGRRADKTPNRQAARRTTTRLARPGCTEQQGNPIRAVPSASMAITQGNRRLTCPCLRFADPDGVEIELPVPDRLSGAKPLGIWLLGEQWTMRFIFPATSGYAYLDLPEGADDWAFIEYES